MPVRAPEHSTQVRPFRRADRDQLTDLVNRHAAAVLPGVSASVNTVLGSLEQRPDEYVTDPWVAERHTLVAVDRARVVAAAHLLRYRGGADVDRSYRDTGAIDWFLHLPGDGASAADHLMSACLHHLSRWHSPTWHADGNLPVPGVCGVPEPWPHIRARYRDAGFQHDGTTELLLIADLADLTDLTAPAGAVRIHRTVGDLGIRFEARLAGRSVGHLEVDTGLDRAERRPRGAALADVADLHLAAEARPDTLPALLSEAADWLRRCGVDRLLAYADGTAVGVSAGVSGSADDPTALLCRHGFGELTRTARGWSRSGR
ncbi:N-acetyltransferase [Streptomyces sp. 796.1]|uniref:N-acetyltransferase n=1 Tax=Streptomyces sp. 796.1 TaxID=3163029 RepID=UPI0039C9864B